ncbi:MAG TPA: DsrH/TusB family sulfur metabolism protein [Dissulfurispiraceae bacterium]|nr:DsrH/TusB family sulfur metabolism protein [Dissulfurispiraceae bacterium]
MLVIIKSAPDTTEGKRGVALAREMATAMMLLQNGVYFVSSGMPVDFGGPVYVLEEDLMLRGLGEYSTGKGMKRVSYEDFVDIMAGSDKVVGMF